MLDNSKIGNSLRKKFQNFTYPTLPFKRELTDSESEAMYLHFRGHSWSDIDANGNIILGGGESAAGKYYITEQDLASLIN